jgi:hypothetical protein
MAHKKQVQGRSYPHLYNVTMTVGSRKSLEHQQVTGFHEIPVGNTYAVIPVERITTVYKSSTEPNKYDDVMLVQYLLKRIYQKAHEYQPPLNPRVSSRFSIAEIKVDGFYGPRTQASINHFQLELRRQGYSIITDGCVDPERTDSGFATISGEAYTITQLNAGFFEKYPPGFLESDPECPPELKSSI